MKKHAHWFVGGWLSLMVWGGWGTSLAAYDGEGYAVLVGIDEYKASTADQLDRVPNLSQTANDVERVRAFLPKIGFSPAKTQVLLNTQATKAAVLSALRRVANQAKRTDRVLFYFSGHGYQISEEEASLVMHDTYRRANHTHLTGTEFRAWAATLRTQKALFVFDSCHSGGLYPSGARGEMCPSRGGKDRGARARYLPNLELEAAYRSRRSRSGASKSPRRIGVMLRKSIHLSWSAAQYHQYACESSLDRGGIFTLLLLRGAESLLSRANATFADLINAYHEQLQIAPYDGYKKVQSPRFLGNAQQPLFFRPPVKPRKPSLTQRKVCQKDGYCIEIWATPSKNANRITSPDLPIGSRIRLHFKVNKASRIRLFIQPTDDKTRTILFHFPAKPRTRYTIPLKARKSLRVIGPPGPILVTAEAWPPTGARGDLLEEDDPATPQTRPKQQPARVTLRFVAVEP